MAIHQISNGELAIKNNNGATVFSLRLPEGWIASEDTPTLFTSPDKTAFIGSLQNSEFQSQHDLLQCTFPIIQQSDDSTLHTYESPVYSISIGKQIFELNRFEKTKCGELSLIKFSEMASAPRAEAYFSPIEMKDGKYEYDGFIFVCLNETARIQHGNTISDAIASIHRN